MQHIAFATRDIFATVTRLKANGVALLPMPENYYDDVESQDRPLGRADRRAAGRTTCCMIATANGEYLQAYTQTFEDRFFFEIVERRGYKGFGANNAPIRLAAQSRLVGNPTP